MLLYWPPDLCLHDVDLHCKCTCDLHRKCTSAHARARAKAARLRAKAARFCTSRKFLALLTTFILTCSMHDLRAACMHACISVCLCAFACLCVLFMFVCVYMHTCLQTHTHTHRGGKSDTCSNPGTTCPLPILKSKVSARQTMNCDKCH